MKKILFIAALTFIVLAGCKKDEDVTVVTDISLNVTTRTIDIPTQYRLIATMDIIAGKPVEGAMLTWSSSNPSVATVNSTGNVTAVAAGTATITAKAGDKTAECVVTIRFVSVTGVVLDRPTLLINVNGKHKLGATVNPAAASVKTVTWSSSNPSIATVDGEGNVTAVAAGETTITVTTTDGGRTASCVVTVN